MKSKCEKRSSMWSVFISISILCSPVLTVLAQDAGSPQENRMVASLAIVSVEGDAEVLSKLDAERSRGEARILTEAWKPAIPRSPLSEGDQIRTGARGSLKLQLTDGTLLTLAGDSVAVVEELRSARGESPQTTQIKLEQGRLVTEQTTKILGQTNQIIRTDNGAINTSIGEIEVWKPSPEIPRVALAGGLPILAQKPPKDETHVSLQRGGATVTSSGIGRIIASSMTTPETCIDNDGVKFTLTNPNDAVTITRLEEEHAYLLTSKKQFYVLVATEGTANSVDIVTLDSAAKIDIEGIAVAEQDANGLSYVKLHPLLTVGIETFAVKVKFACDDVTPGGLNQFDILGDADVFRTSFGLDAERPLPSGSSGSGRLPQRTPTPTPRPEDDDDEYPTPTPAPAPGRTPTPIPGTVVTPPPTPTPVTPPTPVPVTHTHPRNPVITGLRISAGIQNSGGCLGGSYYVSFQLDYHNYLPSVMGGRMEYRISNDSFVTYSPNYYRIPEDVITLYYQYPTTVGGMGLQQLESGTFQGHFCFMPISPADPTLYLAVSLWDLEGNDSGGFLDCQLNVTTGATCR